MEACFNEYSLYFFALFAVGEKKLNIYTNTHTHTQQLLKKSVLLVNLSFQAATDEEGAGHILVTPAAAIAS